MALALYKQIIDDYHLDTLDEVITALNNDISEAVLSKNLVARFDYNNALMYIAAKTIVVSNEVLILVAAGRPMGAMGLCRNLYEQLIHLLFFEYMRDDNQFDSIIHNYFINAQRSSAKTRAQIAEMWKDKESGEETHEEVLTVQAAKDKKTRGDYWWANKSSFGALAKWTREHEKAMSIYDLLVWCHAAYLEASTILHSSSRGNTHGILQNSKSGSVIDTMPTIEVGKSLLFFTSCTIGIVGTVCSQFGIAGEEYLRKLKGLALQYQSKTSAQS